MERELDLTALAERLREAGEHRKLAAAIARWTHRNSRMSDLDHACTLLRHIPTLRAARLPLQHVVGDHDLWSDVEASIFAQAILLYVRAAATGDRGRSHAFDIRGLLPAEERLTHDELVALRQTTIAHFDGESKQSWNRDRALLVPRQDGAWGLGFSFSRTTFEPPIFDKFQRLLTTLLPRLQEVLNEESERLLDVLTEASVGDRALADELGRCRFDRGRFFGLAVDQFTEIMAKPEGRLVRNINGPLGSFGEA